MKRPTRKQVAQAIQMFAPETGSAVPEWVDKAANRKPRSDTGKRQGETAFLHRLIKPFKAFLRMSWPEGSVWLARNNSGCWKRPDGAYLHYGLGTGTSDAIGWTVRRITPEDVGTCWAVFTALEAKSEDGVLTEPQRQFLDALRAAGGIALTATPAQEAETTLLLGRGLR